MAFKWQEKTEENIMKTQSVIEGNYSCNMYKIKWYRIIQYGYLSTFDSDCLNIDFTNIINHQDPNNPHEIPLTDLFIISTYHVLKNKMKHILV